MPISTLIETKLQRPRLGQHLISRPQLIERLDGGLNCKLILISAQAGAGKTTLLVQWLEQCPTPSAWLSVDEHDNDLMVFLSYLCAAIRTVHPDACGEIVQFINAPQAPPLRAVTTALVNELNALFGQRERRDGGVEADPGLILALDDYHKITEPAIHQLVSELIAYLPQRVHLALTSRTDPPLRLAGLRARSQMMELRTADLRLSIDEAAGLLGKVVGRNLSDETVRSLEEKTDGWAVGLRLAALSIQHLPEDANLIQRFEVSAGATLVDYLVSEVLSQQTTARQEFLLQTSILERFNGELCNALLGNVDHASPAGINSDVSYSRSLLKELYAANLFLVLIDQRGWYSYHHLFRDLLLNRLQRQYSPDHIAGLHRRASRWFEENGFIEEAMEHAFAAGDLDRAAQILSRQRFELLNQTRWQRLDRYLKLFPAEFSNQQPDLLILKAWLLHHQSHFSQLPATLNELDAILDRNPMSPEARRHLRGEISTLRSLLAYYRTDAEQTAAEAKSALKNVAPELWIVRILARIYLAGAYQMQGESRRAYVTVFEGLAEDAAHDEFFKATMLVTACSLYWVTADLSGLEQAARQSIDLCRAPHSTQIKGHAHYHLASALYHQNRLAEAEEQFAAITQRPYLNYGNVFSHSSYGLSLVYEAQGRSEDARQVASSVVTYMVETGNGTLLQEARAFQAELALRQGRLPLAELWAAQFDAIPPISPMPRFYRPQLTLAKVWLAQDSPASRQKASALLDQLQDYNERFHNISVLIEVLALQAIRHAEEGNEQVALDLLARAAALAEPGGFVRLFVDLGPTVAQLLQTLFERNISPDYIGRILAVFRESGLVQDTSTPSTDQIYPPSTLNALTSREMEVLELLSKHLTNKEIAARLFISPGTVKSHTLSIYSKLDVSGRRQAVRRARELGLLPAA